jgi:hypothetical protein
MALLIKDIFCNSIKSTVKSEGSIVTFNSILAID